VEVGCGRNGKNEIQISNCFINPMYRLPYRLVDSKNPVILTVKDYLQFITSKVQLISCFSIATMLLPTMYE
jgi:hypothetical protein